MPDSWQPTYRFFRSGKAVAVSTWLHPGFSLDWKFSQASAKSDVFSHFRCRINALDGTFFGSGYSFNPRLALVKSFAEAWERVWLEVVARSSHLPFSKPESSNGFAAGSTVETAIDAAKSELIERSLLLEAWANKRGWIKLTNLSLISRLHLSRLNASGWNARFYQIRSNPNLGTTLAALAFHRDFGVVFDTKNTLRAGELNGILRDLLLSLTRMARCRELDPHSITLSELADRTDPIEHHRLYASPSSLEAFEFLELPNLNSDSVELPEPEELQNVILYPGNELPSVAYVHHPRWPKLCWGRESIAGINEWPHPLA